MRYVLCLVLISGAAFADCPPVADRSSDVDALVAEANAAETEMTGRAVSDRMWSVWLDAPDEPAQALLDRGLGASRAYNFLEALDAFDKLIDYCPDYAEGYNQRAFVYFRSGRFDEAEADLRAALERQPRHTGALTGMVHTLRALGREREALPWLEMALEVNPWVPERSLLNVLKGTEL